MNIEEILKRALDERIDEVAAYQLNIDNFRLAIAEIDAIGDPDLSQFRAELEARLQAEVLEQKKAKVMLTVIKKRVDGDEQP
jgi:hypothetical protein